MTTLYSLNKKMAYFVSHSNKNDAGEFIACVAIEGETGYYRTDWTWGKKIGLAQKIADDRNTVAGLTAGEASTIILKSMS